MWNAVWKGGFGGGDFDLGIVVREGWFMCLARVGKVM